MQEFLYNKHRNFLFCQSESFFFYIILYEKFQIIFEFARSFSPFTVKVE